MNLDPERAQRTCQYDELHSLLPGSTINFVVRHGTHCSEIEWTIDGVGGLTYDLGWARWEVNFAPYHRKHYDTLEEAVAAWLGADPEWKIMLKERDPR